MHSIPYDILPGTGRWPDDHLCLTTYLVPTYLTYYLETKANCGQLCQPIPWNWKYIDLVATYMTFYLELEGDLMTPYFRHLVDSPTSEEGGEKDLIVSYH